MSALSSYKHYILYGILEVIMSRILSLIKNCYLYIKYMVNILKCRLYLGVVKKKWRRARLAKPSSRFWPQAHFKTVITCNRYHILCRKRAIFNKLSCISAVKIMMTWRKQSKKDNNAYECQINVQAILDIDRI